QADDGQHQHQQHDQPVQQLAHWAPAVGGVLPGHGVGSCGGGWSGACSGVVSSGAGSSGTTSPGAGSSGVAASGVASPRTRCASASMRSATVSPITVGQASMPKSLRLIAVVAEKPAVRWNGGSG